jgi:acyl carrier protein
MTEDVLTKKIAELIGSAMDLAPDKIDVDARFDRYGIDSAAAISLTEEIEQHVGKPLEPTVFYDYPTIRSLAAHIAGLP